MTYYEFIALMLLVIGFMIAIYARRKERRVFSKWISDNEEKAFHSLNEIIDGKLWVGESLDLIHSKESIESERPKIVYKVDLCRSESGQFILIMLKLDALRKTVYIEDKTVLSESEAKAKLEPYKEVYISTFGEVEIA